MNEKMYDENVELWWECLKKEIKELSINFSQKMSRREISYVTVGRYNGSAAPEDRMIIRNDSIVWNNEELEVGSTFITTTAKHTLL